MPVVAKQYVSKHKMKRKEKTYRAWASMKQRCQNPNNTSYERYGGRGIKVCERWQKFENFREDMGDAPDGLTLDRINNDGDYEPKNCRWVSQLDQQNNRSTTKHFADNMPEPIRSQSKFIDALGGAGVVAQAINDRTGREITSQAVSNWKRRGIPFKYRGTLVVLAQEKEVDTPSDFFGIAGAV